MEPTFTEFKLHGTGAGRVLGQLEAEIMGVAWDKGRLTVRESWQCLQARVGGQRRLAYTTVLTVMRRLAGKGFLLIEAGGRAHIYRPAISAAAFRRLVAHRVLNALLVEFGEPMVLEMVARIYRQDRDRLLALREIIDTCLRAEAGTGPGAGPARPRGQNA